MLDQGVRTWGGVRLALAGAALALLGKDPKRSGEVTLWLTSVSGRADVTGPDAEAVADLLEASDLTPHPAHCLSRALEDPTAGDGPRDVILLTHPRNLSEPAVTAAARERRPGDRLFALSVDDRGRAEFGEWTDGGLIALRSFRVDLAGAEAAKPEAAARPRPAGGEPAWAWDVEPVGFPFRPGIVAEPAGFGFDAAGEWVVVHGRDGVLHGLTLDGSPGRSATASCSGTSIPSSG